MGDREVTADPNDRFDLSRPNMIGLAAAVGMGVAVSSPASAGPSPTGLGHPITPWQSRPRSLGAAGARPQDDDRIAELVPPPPLDVPLDAAPEDHPMRKTFAAVPPAPESALAAQTISWRRADIGAANGHGNARFLARVLSPISLEGKANGVQLLGPATIDLIFQEQANGTDLVLAMPARWGIGYALPKPEAVPDIPNERICYWGGWGGSMAVMNPDRRTTFAYVMNKMGQVTSAGTERTQKYTRLIYQALGSPTGNT
ncbi:MAG TPA: serine hydrolase domain-containing protein [Mycobacterium sp.]|nr:serine hydrolase domain-containing protein [Mycobacterium sp.]